jgi:two-component system NtrC family sensor kinase
MTGARAQMAEEEIDRLRKELDTANEQLLEAHHMASLGRLLASIVHEINTPIGSIFSNNEVILRSLEKLRTVVDDPQPPALEKARKILETCQNLASIDKIACERISSVIRGLKTFARTSDELRKVDLNDNLRATLKLTQAEFRRRVAVETDFGELPEVECYPHLLNQVFLNILINAGQAIEGEGKITVRTWSEGESVMVSITDTGPGIPSEQIARIFQAGFTTKPAGVGTGLGLSISKQIVEERHGGSLSLESRPGAGTTFFIRIPVQHARCAAG